MGDAGMTAEMITSVSAALRASAPSTGQAPTTSSSLQHPPQLNHPSSISYPPPMPGSVPPYHPAAFQANPQYMYGFSNGLPYSPIAGPSMPSSFGPPQPTPTFDSSLPAQRPSVSKQGKRKSIVTENNYGNGTAGTTPDSDDEKPKDKRAKTPRACDPCRRKKIRCDVMSDTNPPLCVHCKAHNLDCTFFLPITETRFKRKKTGDEANTTSPDAQQNAYRIPPHGLPPHANYNGSLNQGFPPPTPLSARIPDPPSRHHSPEARMLGPTSMAHIMHSMSTFPVDRNNAYDTRHLVKWDVRETGDGVIQIHQPEAPPLGHRSGLGPAASQLDVLPPALVEQLINRYFDQHAPVFPMLTKRDFLSLRECHPLLIEVMCGLSAAGHDVPPDILRIIKGNVLLITRDDDVHARSSLQIVQALLIFGFTFELERGMVGTKAWTIFGTAIRMAYDLGLHREYRAVQDAPHADQSELRRRVWAGLVIADRWLSAMYGLPMGIDLADCDRLFPSNIELQFGQAEADVDPRDQPYLAFNKLLELSILLGRVLKLMYTPTGIMGLTDAAALEMEASLIDWQTKLPEHLKHDSPSAVPAAGYLNLCLVPVLFLFCRPFMRISFTCEALTYSFGMQNWDNMAQRAGAAIEWADEHPICIESWAPGLYSLFIASLIQYHIFVRRRQDDAPLALMAKAAELMKRSCNEECLARKKVSEIVCLLHCTAMSIKTMAPGEVEGRRGMNPTAGVRMRPKDPKPRWDPATNSYIGPDGAPVEPATSTTAAGGASSSGSTPAKTNTPATSDMRSTSASHAAPTFPAPAPPADGQPGGTTPWQPDRAQNVNPNLNLPADVSQYLLEPSLDLMSLGSMGDLPLYDTQFFPESLFDIDGWSSFFGSANPENASGSV